MKTLNLNDRVKVKLTPMGMSAFLASNPGKTVAEKVIESGGHWECSLWELFEAFGGHMFVGADPVFVGNTLEILP